MFTHLELSIGQKRRVQVAREFMHDMDLFFLDEPTVGLDPYARKIIIRLYKEKGKFWINCVFYNSYHGRGRISMRSNRHNK